MAGKCPASPAFQAGPRGTIRMKISLAHILFATACPGSPRRACPVLTGWAGSFNIPSFVKGKIGGISEKTVFGGKI